MRKLAVTVLAIVAVLLVVGVIVATLFWKRLSPPSLKPEAFLPADTLLLAEAVDLTRSGLRWRDTEMFKLWREPEMQAFLEKPLANYPPLQATQKWTDDLTKLWPRQAFVAVLALEGNVSKVVAGFSYQGDAQAAERLLAEPRARMKSGHPAGHAQLLLHGQTELQVYTEEGFAYAEASVKGWHFFANDVEALKLTLDRLEAGPAAKEPRLAGEVDYQKALAALPGDPEFRVFVRTGLFIDRLLTAVNASGQSDPASFAELRKLRAVAATTKFEGGQVRDSFFKLEGTSAETSTVAVPQPPALARRSLDLTTSDTAIYFTMASGADAFSKTPASAFAGLPVLYSLAQALDSQKATFADLSQIFEPEVSLIVQKEAGGSLAGTLAVPVKDAARAQGLANAVVGSGVSSFPPLSSSAIDRARMVIWKTSKVQDRLAYTLQSDGIFMGVSPVFLPTEHYWLFGLSAEGAVSFLNQAPQTLRLADAKAYQELTKRVGVPEQAFGYMDLGGLAETYYNTFRPVAALALVGNADLGKYFDAGKLPSGRILGQHIGQLVISERTVPGGRLWEELGNISLPHLVLAGAAAFASSGPDLSSLIESASSMVPGLGASASGAPATRPVADESPTPSGEQVIPAPAPTNDETNKSPAAPATPVTPEKQ